MLDISAGQTINWNGHRARLGVFACAALVEGLGGSEITIWSYISWSPSGFGQSKNFGDRTNASEINLAPDKPWRLNLTQTAPLANLWTDPAFVPNNTVIANARVGNCDASGGKPVNATKSTNAGGNRNVTFDGVTNVTSAPAGKALTNAGGAAPTRLMRYHDLRGRSSNRAGIRPIESTHAGSTTRCQAPARLAVAGH